MTKHDEAEHRRRAARYTAPCMEVTRARIVLMAAQGLQHKDKTERLMLPVQIVSKWRKRDYHEGLAGLDERPRPDIGRVAARVSRLLCNKELDLMRRARQEHLRTRFATSALMKMYRNNLESCCDRRQQSEATHRGVAQ